ncbi:Amino acid/amide ABC transporter substrate-binding protein (HAAT family) [Rubrivivax sp. A210]|uniref:ABC transporter substrate-binding protein n=1 Tax=Rubrivivax sp. A210 TaxID=2772301 RepID=UPI0019181010|nr:ABC transporter substrate-binding protein [Rubrivivax sp. A210]CAD5372298.1 Amino acid/amide ABC transporter substrate-binding protein (HAAT family) [Rubrivivax sp. A210]
MKTLLLPLLTGLTLMAGTALAAEPVKIAAILELSGAGVTSGTNFKNGVELAVKEINAAGGILGRTLELNAADTQSNPGVAKGLAQKAVDDGVFAVFGPVFSGSIAVSMNETRRAEVPNFTGGEAAAITKQGNPYIFRTSFTQDSAMPRVARYIAQTLKAKTLALVYVNNDYGKGGRESLLKALEPLGVKVVADISTEQGQIDFSAATLKAKQSHADAVFVYTNEEEAARVLRELRKLGLAKPVIGETVLTSQKVIELAGEAANGAVAHVGLTVDAPIAGVQAFRAKFEKEFKYTPDHNGVKGYTGIYIMKAAIEKVGKFDRRAVAQALHGLAVSVAQQPGVLMDVSIDGNGDIDRESFLTEARGGKQVIKAVLPALRAKQ